MTGTSRAGKLAGKTVLVTGAGSGIGAAYAQVSAREGAELILLDRDAESLKEAAARFEGEGTACRARVLDIGIPADVDLIFDELRDDDITLDGAFLNAGINAGQSLRHEAGELDRLERSVWHQVLDVNLHGFFYTLQRTAELMKKAGKGSIVVTSSTAGLRAEPLVSYPYVAAKAAVNGVTRQAALELVKYGVRINAIAPGSFNTNIGGRGPRPEGKTELWNRAIPMGRWGNTSELEGLALLLISDDSSFMTGGIYVADGGASVLSQVRSDEL